MSEIVEQSNSGSLGQLAVALAKAQQRCRAAPHDARNEHHKFNYTSSEAIIEEAKAALESCGLALVPLEQTLVSSPDGCKMARKFLLVHDSGECCPMTLDWPVIPGAGRPLDKATAGAATLSLAYLLRDLLLMPRVEKDTEVSGREDRGREPPVRPQKTGKPVRPAQQPEQGPPVGEFIAALNKSDRIAARAGYFPPGGLVQWLTDQLYHGGMIKERSKPDTWPGDARNRAATLVAQRHTQETESGKADCPPDLRTKVEDAADAAGWSWEDAVAWLQLPVGTPPTGCSMGQMRRLLTRLQRPELFPQQQEKAPA